MTTTPTIDDVLGYLRQHATAEDLDVTSSLVTKRRDVLNLVDSALIRVGAQVTIRGMKPKYFNGLTGTVASVGTGHKRVRIATIDLDEASAARLSRATTKYTTPLPGIPLSALRAL